jgi:hypothetical protein
MRKSFLLNFQELCSDILFDEGSELQPVSLRSINCGTMTKTAAVGESNDEDFTDETARILP